MIESQLISIKLIDGATGAVLFSGNRKLFRMRIEIHNEFCRRLIKQRLILTLI
jgi:hypothetical protein